MISSPFVPSDTREPRAARPPCPVHSEPLRLHASAALPLPNLYDPGERDKIHPQKRGRQFEGDSVMVRLISTIFGIVPFIPHVLYTDCITLPIAVDSRCACSRRGCWLVRFNSAACRLRVKVAFPEQQAWTEGLRHHPAGPVPGSVVNADRVLYSVMGSTVQLRHYEAPRTIQDMVGLYRSGKLHLERWQDRHAAVFVHTTFYHAPAPYARRFPHPANGRRQDTVGMLLQWQTSIEIPADFWEIPAEARVQYYLLGLAETTG